MAAVPGYLTKVQIGGTPVAFVDESMSNIGGDNYRIDDGIKEMWDPTIGVTFEDNGVPIPSSEIDKVDHMFGIVYFNTSQSGPVTVSGSYVPLTTVAGAFTQSMDMSGDVLDVTTYVDGQTGDGYRKKLIGIIDVEVTLERFHDISDKLFFNAINNRTLLALNIQPGGSGREFRGWFYAAKEDHTGDVNSVEQANVTFNPGGIDGQNFSIM